MVGFTERRAQWLAGIGNRIAERELAAPRLLRVEEPARAHTGSPAALASAMRNAVKMSREVGSWDVTILRAYARIIAYVSGGVTCVYNACAIVTAAIASDHARVKRQV